MDQSTDGGAPHEVGCAWEEDLRPAGISSELPRPFRIGISLLGLATLAGAVLAAYLTAGPGPDPAGAGLAAAAAVPWAMMLLARRDHGPRWWFAASALIPLALLGFGQWSSVPLGLDDGLAVTFPVLLLVLLYTAFASARSAVGAAVAGYAAVTGPPLIGWLLEQSTVTGTAVAIWHMGFAFCVVAGYAVRFSYETSKELGAAREALAWQAGAEERRRAAQDVHDVVAHTLAITMLHVTAARMAVRRSAPQEAEDALEEAERHGRASLADIRRVVRLLRSGGNGAGDHSPQPTLDDVGALVDSYRAAGLKVDLELSGNSAPGSATAELTIYRVLQEALANAVRHGAGPATVELRARSEEITLEVSNPAAAAAAESTPGTGLLGMRERAAAADGTVEAGTQDGRWLVRARVPRRASRDPRLASSPDVRPAEADDTRGSRPETASPPAMARPSAERSGR